MDCQKQLCPKNSFHWFIVFLRNFNIKDRGIKFLKERIIRNTMYVLYLEAMSAFCLTRYSNFPEMNLMIIKSTIKITFRYYCHVCYLNIWRFPG